MDLLPTQSTNQPSSRMSAPTLAPISVEDHTSDPMDDTDAQGCGEDNDMPLISSYTFAFLSSKAISSEELEETNPELYHFYQSIPESCVYTRMLCLYLGWIDSMSISREKPVWVMKSNWPDKIRRLASFENALVCENGENPELDPLRTKCGSSFIYKPIRLFGKEITPGEFIKLETDNYQGFVLQHHFPGYFD